MIRVPWWVFLAVFAAGGLAVHLWGAGTSDAAMDGLRAQRDSAHARADVAESLALEARALADSATEAHAALAQRSIAEIARYTRRIQATTARAESLADSIRAVVDSEAAGLVSEMEAEWQAVVEAERAQTATWEARALSAERGWRDERFARLAADDVIRAMQAERRAQDALVRALEAEIRRANRDKRILAVAGVGLALAAFR